MITMDQILKDAEELRGLLANDWRKALLIVRNVEPGAGQGRRLPHDRAEVEKVSSATFAQAVSLPGYGRNVIRRTLQAWERAATDQLVPPTEDLSPGDEIDLPTGVAWEKYYSAKRRKSASGRGIDFEKDAGDEFVSKLNVWAEELRVRLDKRPPERLEPEHISKLATIADTCEKVAARIRELTGDVATVDLSTGEIISLDDRRAQ